MMKLISNHADDGAAQSDLLSGTLGGEEDVS